MPNRKGRKTSLSVQKMIKPRVILPPILTKWRGTLLLRPEENQTNYPAKFLEEILIARIED